MRYIEDHLVLSPTDLSAFLACRHRAGLELSAAQGLISRPDRFDPYLEALRNRGEEHERRYVESLVQFGLTVVDVRDEPDRVKATREALREGVDAVIQGALEADGWRGYADVLRRVERPSALGAWSYEPYDTKLARETRAGTILQLMVYSELLAGEQGIWPERFHVVTPDPVTPLHSFRVDQYAAYYRLVKRNLANALTLGADGILGAWYPEPVEHCEVCRWWPPCNDRRRRDDHLGFIAGIGRLHCAELQVHGIATLAAAAAMPLPIVFNSPW